MRVLSEEKLNNMLAYIREYAHDNNGDIPALSKIMENLFLSGGNTVHPKSTAERS